MSLEVQNDFAATFARHSVNLENWQVHPHRINHVVQDWWDKFSQEHPTLFVQEYYENPKPEWIVKEIFKLFFSQIGIHNHVHVPKEVQEAAVVEYLED